MTFKPPRKGSNTPVIVPRPLNIVEEGSWMTRAACRDEDPALFYDHDHETPKARYERTLIAKDICHGCVVKKQCLDTAMHNQEAYGIWGGHTAPERWQLAKFLREEKGA